MCQAGLAPACNSLNSESGRPCIRFVAASTTVGESSTTSTTSVGSFVMTSPLTALRTRECLGYLRAGAWPICSTVGLLPPCTQGRLWTSRACCSRSSLVRSSISTQAHVSCWFHSVPSSSAPRLLAFFAMCVCVLIKENLSQRFLHTYSDPTRL